MRRWAFAFALTRVTGLRLLAGYSMPTRQSAVFLPPSRRHVLSTIGGAAALTVNPRTTGGVSTSWNKYIDATGCRRLPREILVEVADPSATVTFLTKALGMITVPTSSGEAAVAFGPTQLDKPPDFIPGVSSFDEDGAHCSIVVRRGPATTPGDGLAYVQLSLPFIRASKLLAYGGNITEAYGAVNVIAPGGLPLRLLVGDEVKDRCMYLALRVQNVKQSEKFYRNQLGMRRFAYPRARPPTPDESPFDPDPPRGSVFLAYCTDSLGILLVPSTKNRLTGNYFKPNVGDVYGGINVEVPPDDPILASTSSPTSAPALYTDPDGYKILLSSV